MLYPLSYGGGNESLPERSFLAMAATSSLARTEAHDHLQSSQLVMFSYGHRANSQFPLP
jgi:hypothetical protein